MKKYSVIKIIEFFYIYFFVKLKNFQKEKPDSFKFLNDKGMSNL